MNAISSAQPQTIPLFDRLVVPAAAAPAVIRTAAPEAAISAPRDPHRFNDALEAAFTGIVITGVLLFAAGMLREAVPVCTMRMIGNDMLILAAIASGAVSLFFVGRNIFGR